MYGTLARASNKYRSSQKLLSTFDIPPPSVVMSLLSDKMNNDDKKEIYPGNVCHFHPERKAEWRCASCKRVYCNDCTVHKRVGKFVAHICPEESCRGKCLKVSVDEATGTIESMEESQEEGGGKKKQKSKVARIFSRRYLTRFYLALILPCLALATHDVFLIIQGRTPHLWLLLAWAGLIFLMSGRYFWPYVTIALFTAGYTIYCFQRLYSHQFHPEDNTALYGISLGLWGASLLFLAVSSAEFTE